MTRLEILSIPAYFTTMGAEYVHHRRRRERGVVTDGDYEARDTLTSLTMGTLSLVMPLVWPKIVDPITPGRGRYAKYLIGGTVAAFGVTTIADVVVRRTADAAEDTPGDTDPTTRDGATGTSAGTARRATDTPGDTSTRRRRRMWNRLAKRVARYGGAATIAGGVVAATTAWNNLIRPQRMWRNRIVPDLGTGVVAWSVAILGWDFLYYLNHRIWHSTRFMWANHVMHHSSERYNLSTALRQAITDPLLILVPYSGLSLLGVRPELIATSRGINLLYQYWIHTDAIRTLGPLESFANTPSHHRVHHGSDLEYIDRNHGGMLIVFDRALGTFTRERQTPTYGLTKNIESFNPLVVATHEYVDILRDVAGSDNWRDRLSFTFRGPGWAYERHREATGRHAAVPHVTTNGTSPDDHMVPTPVTGTDDALGIAAGG